jgi:biotin-dependent carboxylase-like uncharacterized protein
MDRLSFDWANRLCGNPAGVPALEITFGGLELLARAALQIAVTGPEAELAINDAPAGLWRGHNLLPGDRVRLGHARRGCRLYLAVRGGFAVDPVFGSAATVPREQLGGIAGRALVRGDALPVDRARPDQPAARRFYLPPPLRPPYPGEHDREHWLRVIPCLQARVLPRAEKRRFFAAVYQLSAHCDRMGYRLSGEALDLPPMALLSEGITPGTIQIPADGQPIVLMRDHQTLGGYPRIGTLLAVDIDRLAQLRSGDRVRFAPISIDGARRALFEARRGYQRTCPVALDGQPL